MDRPTPSETVATPVMRRRRLQSQIQLHQFHVDRLQKQLDADGQQPASNPPSTGACAPPRPPPSHFGVAGRQLTRAPDDVDVYSMTLRERHAYLQKISVDLRILATTIPLDTIRAALKDVLSPPLPPPPTTTTQPLRVVHPPPVATKARQPSGTPTMSTDHPSSRACPIHIRSSTESPDRASARHSHTPTPRQPRTPAAPHSTGVRHSARLRNRIQVVESDSADDTEESDNDQDSPWQAQEEAADEDTDDEPSEHDQEYDQEDGQEDEQDDDRMSSDEA